MEATDRDDFRPNVQVEQEEGEDREGCMILKHIETSSMDEYDDFNPRHPMPKDKAHRRGDSYFNSDVDLYANDAVVGMSTGDMAKLAAAEGDDGPVGNLSLKEKFMALKLGKSVQQAKPFQKVRAKQELQASDDEN